MKYLKSLLIAASILGLHAPAKAMFNDDPVLSKLMSEFEILEEDGRSAIEWDIDYWIGRDLSKFWIKSSGEAGTSDVHQANIELSYSRAISAYWDTQFGIRHDFETDDVEDARNWVSYGFIGTAPYFVEVDARVFIGESSSSQLLIELEREMMITQEWVLTPEMDIIMNGKTQQQYGEGSGLSEIEFSLRLGYEHNTNRKFQPFIGVTAKQKFGRTKSLAENAGEHSDSLELMFGVHSWF